MSELKTRLAECVRRARAGERIRISSRGEVVAELCAAMPESQEPGTAGLQELVLRGTARQMVRNDPSRYRTYERALPATTSQELLDWERGDR